MPDACVDAEDDELDDALGDGDGDSGSGTLGGGDSGTLGFGAAGEDGTPGFGAACEDNEDVTWRLGLVGRGAGGCVDVAFKTEVRFCSTEFLIDFSFFAPGVSTLARAEPALDRCFGATTITDFSIAEPALALGCCVSITEFLFFALELFVPFR